MANAAVRRLRAAGEQGGWVNRLKNNRTRLSETRLRVGIADDHEIVRVALAEMIQAQTDLHLAGQACDGRGAVELARRSRLDVLVMDLAMPGRHGEDAITIIRDKTPALGVLVLTTCPLEIYAPRMLRLGAMGFLSKQCEPGEVLRAVRTIGCGQRYLQPELVDLLRRTRCNGPQAHDALTEKEFQVFIKLAQGGQIATIAREISVSAKTVGNYRRIILEKLALETSSDLSRYALRHRLIDQGA